MNPHPGAAGIKFPERYRHGTPLAGEHDSRLSIRQGLSQETPFNL